jgi:hypothetical protein
LQQVRGTLKGKTIRDGEIQQLGEFWNVLLTRNAPAKKASYTSLERMLLSIEGLDESNCSEFKSLYHNRMKNGAKTKIQLVSKETRVPVHYAKTSKE